MTTNRPTAITPARNGRPSPLAPDATDPARGELDDELAAALWLYAWSHDALRPTGEILAARLSTPPVLGPGRRLGRLSPRDRPRQTAPLDLRRNPGR
jgi:hypothetical protein